MYMGDSEMEEKLAEIIKLLKSVGWEVGLFVDSHAERVEFLIAGPQAKLKENMEVIQFHHSMKEAVGEALSNEEDKMQTKLLPKGNDPVGANDEKKKPEGSDDGDNGPTWH